MVLRIGNNQNEISEDLMNESDELVITLEDKLKNLKKENESMIKSILKSNDIEELKNFIRHMHPNKHYEK